MRTPFPYLTLALAALAAAESTTTVGLFGSSDESDSDIAIPSYTSVAGSVVSINALETVYAVSCLSGAKTESCSIKDPWTITQGISTLRLSAEYTAFEWQPPVTATFDYDCSFQSYSESASCTFSVYYSGSSDGLETSSSYSTHTSIASDKVEYYALEVTGGLDKFDKPEATETPGAAAAGVLAGPVQAIITAAPMLAAGVAAVL
ncbi:predicted protein [Aspergillus nidulans FGSC A4]|uniref:Uncharacterized protein n=1 Tax=Emericella nidulans (strain FGSC A4 / ATCC 38163 / CBS 112.46 / NRRL 194 / M139) TaxID=227321 RepID=Q5B220_EMENI|nr:hypothetical protein [Aspergillus nidulans FGSC A4]EAA62570.1 predicted protein [Aspergillus nidulans FGSC A4]CBF81957.1 TPA: hypothetical protein ANIA_05410 [Aspergillus nidulans FGSC A4]|eukprot:XP_663014.1 predicted protein [Aspergillus nidulans FGSC A4]